MNGLTSYDVCAFEIQKLGGFVEVKYVAMDLGINPQTLKNKLYEFYPELVKKKVKGKTSKVFVDWNGLQQIGMLEV